MVESTNDFQNDLCFIQLPQVLMSMRETAEQMISVVQSALKAFEMQQASLVGSVDIQLVSVCGIHKVHFGGNDKYSAGSC